MCINKYVIWYMLITCHWLALYTLQGIKISRLGKRKLIFKTALGLGEGYVTVVPRRVYIVAILPSTRNQEASRSAPGLCPFSLSWKLTDVPWKSLVGRCVPYWNSRPFIVFQSFWCPCWKGQCQPKNIENRNERQVTLLALLCVCKYVIMLHMICIIYI